MGEVGYLDYRSNPGAYVYARVLDGLVEAKLALEMLSRGLMQNAAAKAFVSVKSIVSALVVNNISKLIEGKPDMGKGLV
jgi:Archaeal PaREP1/PaREP8 family.